jgi:hypothetical protein
MVVSGIGGRMSEIPLMIRAKRGIGRRQQITGKIVSFGNSTGEIASDCIVISL